MRFEELLERFEDGGPSHAEAASALGVSERTFAPPAASATRTRGGRPGRSRFVRPSPRRAPEDELERMRSLYQQHYQGFTVNRGSPRGRGPRLGGPQQEAR